MWLAHHIFKLRGFCSSINETKIIAFCKHCSSITPKWAADAQDSYALSSRSWFPPCALFVWRRTAYCREWFQQHHKQKRYKWLTQYANETPLTNKPLISRSELSYQLRYAEQNQRSTEVPWSIRQMAVYHHHSSFPDFDFFIFINPLDNAPFETQLQSLAKPNANNQTLLNTICDDPFRLHMMPCSSYLGNWRWYFRYLGGQFQQKV